ncbi:MAG: putative esterase [Streptosporangiaceae bacterium]|nr:putative esterase [Streptosporangiaceae bacterium]
MGLTSSGFIDLLFVLVAVSITAAVWSWPRFAGPGAAPVLSRLGLLAVTQVATLVAVLAWVNAYYEFYAGWDDLLGVNAGVAQVQQVRGASPVPGPVADVPVKRLSPTGKGANPGRDGAVEEFRFHGANTALSADTYVRLPPQYFKPAFATRRFPVAIVLTGYPGNPAALIHAMHVPALVRKGELSGKVQPMILLMMRPTVAPPRDTECTDVPGGPQVETFFSQDVQAAMASHYRVATGRGGWGIMGDSTGGYCAAKMALRHPDRFAAAASLSGYFRALQDLTTGDLYGGSKAVRNENDLLWRAQHLPAPAVSLLVASCRIGERTFPEAQRFLALVRPPTQAQSLFLDSGGHNFRTFRRMMPTALEWLSARLRPE